MRSFGSELAGYVTLGDRVTNPFWPSFPFCQFEKRLTLCGNGRAFLGAQDHLMIMSVYKSTTIQFLKVCVFLNKGEKKKSFRFFSFLSFEVQCRPLLEGRLRLF